MRTNRGKLDFYYEDKIVGEFLGIAACPRQAGRYRYMPYRGPGHLQDKCQRLGFANCSFVDGEGRITFTARTTAEKGVIDVSGLPVEWRT